MDTWLPDFQSILDEEREKALFAALESEDPEERNQAFEALIASAEDELSIRATRWGVRYGLCAEDAKDAVQVAKIRFWLKVTAGRFEYTGVCSTQRFLTKSVHFDLKKQAGKSTNSVSFEDEEGDEWLRSADEAPIEHGVDEKLRFLQARKEIEALPETDRIWFITWLESNLTTQELAEQFGLRKTTFHNNMTRILRHLKGLQILTGHTYTEWLDLCKEGKTDQPRALTYRLHEFLKDKLLASLFDHPEF